ncbi:AMP-binding protein [Corynebacterium phoceense]|uniref:AMP-binding protein n=1 Tax=Corynebacterium TaxID=1716 RepID=UPI000839C60B|nr:MULTISPECIES: AMP-binding protein [Corynebacterium]MCQ9330362.1 AMP-binding protein [Corynebacterium phoceense]MCQ9348443.1 AMP-binding protein [Corynebacterium phoceense]OFL78010.1 AMP-binding protein [Corynebacterium sp. HMSC077B05]
MTIASTFATRSTPYGAIAVDADGNDLSYVFGKTLDEGAPPLREDTLGDTLRATVQKFPSRDAIVDVYSDKTLSYEQFYKLVLALASALARKGLRPGDRVGIWSTNRWEWLVVMWACHHLGLILVNINPAYRQSELNYVLEKSGTRMVFAARRYKDSDYRSMLNDARKQRGTQVEDVIYFGGDEWFSFIEGPVDDLSQYTAGLSNTDVVNLQFTSGTTGFPKGASLTHRNILNNGYFVGELLGFTEADRVCTPVPFFHCFGMVMATIAAFSRGGAIIIPAPSFKPRESLKAVQAAGATALYGVPTMFIQELTEAEDHIEYGSPYDLSTLRTGIMAGSSCPSKTMREVISELNMPEVAICYGMTETSPVSFQTRADDPLDKRVGTVGQIMPHLEAKIVDEDTGEIVPVGTQGEILVRGYSVMKEYWEHPEKTAEAIDADGWMRTGDLGVFDDEGYLSVTGRLKDMLIRGGENIYPREIEEFLRTHPSVVDAEVIGVPDDKYGEEIMAWLILHEGAEHLTQSDIAEFAHGQLSRQKIPRYVHVVDSYPMTASGKVRKVELREMAPKVLGWV